MRGVPREIEAVLAALGQPWELKAGNRHVKIMVRGQLAGVLPLSGKHNSDRRAALNLVSQIRRVAATGGVARRG